MELTGTPGDDTLVGTTGNDLLLGGGGNDRLLGDPPNGFPFGADTLDGGDGQDVAVYWTRMTDYSIQVTDTGLTVTSLGNPEDSDTLISIERLQFSDAAVVFDASGNVGLAYRLFEAALHRVPDAASLGYIAAQLDSGVSAIALAQEFVASPELAAAHLDANALLAAAESQASIDAASAAAHAGIAFVPTVLGTPGADEFNVNEDTRDVEGGAGIDSASFAGARADYFVAAAQPPMPGETFTFSATSWASVTGPDASTCLLTSVERLHFSDATVAVDLGGHAGEAYRLYGAAFGRAPDQAGLTYQVHALDTGASLSRVAANFLASAEFAAQSGSLDNTQFVTQLYHNALHRDPDAGGLAFHIANLDAGMSRADVLIAFAESPENQASLLGVIGSGIVLDS